MHDIQKRLLALSKVRDLSKLSIRETGRQVAVPGEKPVHPQQVKYHLDQLIDGGQLSLTRRPKEQMIDRDSFKGFKLSFISIPILGSADCGPATIYADGTVKGHIRVSPSLLKSRDHRNLYALQASGESMNQAQIDEVPIRNGDYVIVDRSRITPRSGEYVVFQDDNKANIKKLFLDHANEQIVLRSESTEDYDPIYIDPREKWDGLIQGTVIQVMRRPKIEPSLQ